jgi:hypothetical protein
VTRHTLFDLTAVVTTATTPDEAAALAKLMRQIGLKRFVMGSDYDSFTPKSTDDLTRAKLHLSNPTARQLQIAQTLSNYWRNHGGADGQGAS